MIRLTPCAAVMRSAAFIASPWIHSKVGAFARALDASRFSALTRQPHAASFRATSPPIPPVAPSTSATCLFCSVMMISVILELTRSCRYSHINEIDEIRATTIHKSMNKEPEWHFYRTLLAVLEYGSLSAAARNLGLTQPTVGRHIDALE